ncbi:cytochrome P450, family 1, subfamily b, polypeptide 1 [Chelydra serpentina]|uniref:Cytochrome P450, family 1, subfamily b, polypeptide 1 n=1 Tax=Chelydra serpentina TaxID=8475 RepID=A0A8T1T2D4_CHESE|nr:cytochrome P450, family 1, subfamily b, polypeptide 1 [Chelydra serpentina]
MAQRYGDVFQLRLGRQAVVVLNGEAAIRQALVRQGGQFAGRPDFPSFRLVSGGRSLAFGRYSEQWRAHRRLAHASLRAFSTASGRSRRLFEQHVAAEARELIRGFLRRGAGGAYFDPCPLFTVANANVICALCFGQRYGHDDGEFRALLGRNDKFGQTVGAGSLVDVLPWLQAFPNPVRRVFRDFQALNREMHDFVRAKVAQHRRTYDPRLTRDISDAVIGKIEQGGGGGFRIPKDTVVFVNQWSVNHDRHKWKDPHLFDPARFLDGEQKLDSDLTCSVMIFSIGKRRCIGDQLSKLQIFLFTAILLHQCTFEANPAERLTMDCIHGLALKPLPFTVSVKMRDTPQSCRAGDAE